MTNPKAWRGIGIVAMSLFLFAAVPAARAAITRVQQPVCANGGATTIACTLTSTPVNGNALIAVIGTRGTSDNRVSSITQTGATWTRQAQRTNANGVTVEIWAAFNVSGAATSVTINLAASVKASAIIAEYSGLATSSVLDQTSTGATGSSASPSTGTTATTTQADELWIGAMANINTNTYSAQTNSFSEVAESASTGGSSSTRNNAVMEERIVSATGAASTGATLSGTQQWTGVIATFKASLNPTISTYTNDTDSTLNFSACGTTGCGGRIGQTITVSGSNFGTPSNQDTCTSGAANGCVRIGDYTVPAANISVWNATTITFTVPSGTATFGGSGTTCGSSSNGICVTQNALSTSALQFWVFPDITSISPSGAGAAKEGDSITITGTRFDTTQGIVEFINCGTSSATVGTWGDTSITVTVPTGITDTDDSCDVRVTRAAGTGSKTDTSANFVVLPKIISLATCSGCGTNTAREHAAGVDTDGLVMLSGNHFGTSQGTGGVQFTGNFGSVTATIHATAEGPCTVGGWAAAATSVCIEVSPSISDSVSNGTITLTRNGDAQTNVWSLFFVAPRITSVTPSSGTIGDRIRITGNHFCQGSCPTSPNRSLLGTYVKFGTTQALDSEFVDSGTSPCSGNAQAWTFTEVCVKVPIGTPEGPQPITVAHGMISNAAAFTRASTAPSISNLRQFKVDGTTPIPQGGYANTDVVFKADLTSPTAGNLIMQIEVANMDDGLLCPPTGFCNNAIDGTVGDGGACTSCTSLPNAQIIGGGTEGVSYVWAARTRNATTDEYSPWAFFGGFPDFIVDTAAPTITFPSGNTCSDAVSELGSNSAKISWTLGESADGQVQYSTNSDLSSSSNYPSSPNPIAASHQITIPNLNSGTTYYFKAKSTDAAGNLAQRPTGQPFCSFTTVSVTQPNKTTQFFVVDNSNIISAGTLATNAFSVLTSETSPSVKSAFVELTGITNSPGTNSVQVQVNSQAARTYVIDAAAKTTFKIYYEVTAGNLNLNDSPSANVFKITPSLDTYIVSAKIHVNYAYTP